jgi:hypothetical protein
LDILWKYSIVKPHIIDYLYVEFSIVVKLPFINKI